MSDRTQSLRYRAGTRVWINIVLLTLIFLMVNYLGMRSYVRADWTKSGLYTLSDKSTSVLRSMKQDVSVYVMWGQTGALFSDVRELLERYRAITPKLKIEYIDPDRDPARFKMIVDRFGAKMREMEGGMVAVEASVIFSGGDRVKFVSSYDVEEIGEQEGGQGEGQGEKNLSSFKAEQAFTSAILAVTSERQAKICYTQGHDEWSPQGEPTRNLSHLVDSLKQDNYKVEPVTTLGAARIPADCDLVLVIGPARPFLSEEADLLGRYLAEGGDLLLFLDPIIEGSRFVPTGLEKLASNAGIVLDQDLVVEPNAKRLLTIGGAETFIADKFTDHPAVKKLAIPQNAPEEIRSQLGSMPVGFSLVRTLSVKEALGRTVEPLAQASAESWGERDLGFITTGEEPVKGVEDRAGPAVIAEASEPAGKESGGRLVVVGDSDALNERFFVNEGFQNRDFFAGLVGWLAQRESLISIAPKNPEYLQLSITQEDMSRLEIIALGVMPLFGILLGIFVWRRRRS